MRVVWCRKKAPIIVEAISLKTVHVHAVAGARHRIRSLGRDSDGLDLEFGGQRRNGQGGDTYTCTFVLT